MLLLSGGMGGGAVDIFNKLNIEVVTGANGNAENALENYLSGNLNQLVLFAMSIRIGECGD
jgi:predicted Fe-Mo cluster-binding NifX family protein